MQSRKVVTRSGRGFRGYFPSKKLNRMVEYESLLERDALYLFECSPGVKSYRAQPELIFYEHRYQTHKYYPDFEVVLNSGSVFHIEVKPSAKLLSCQLLSKMIAIEMRYHSHLATFKLMTDNVIRQEPLFSNLKTINQFKKYEVDISPILKKIEAMLVNKPETNFSEIADVFGLAYVLVLLAQHRLFCDFNQPLSSPTNYLRLPKESDHDTVFF
jgi:hypothetical protein